MAWITVICRHGLAKHDSVHELNRRHQQPHGNNVELVLADQELGHKICLIQARLSIVT